jgi:hypothetical protein
MKWKRVLALGSLILLSVCAPVEETVSKEADWIIGNWSSGEPSLQINKKSKDGYEVNADFGGHGLVFKAKIKCIDAKCTIHDQSDKKMLEVSKMNVNKMKITWAAQAEFVSNGGVINGPIMPINMDFIKNPNN